MFRVNSMAAGSDTKLPIVEASILVLYQFA